MKQPYKTDIAVLLLFFNRPETFQQVFNEVKKARPSRLFLYQDGMRGERDRAGVEACRQIASDENINWECEVHRLYQEKNLGCDPSEYVSQKWAFSIVDKCIVLEDDDVPSQAFFPFCKEMLDRYEHDSRVWMIAGFNTDEITPDVPTDYFFTSVFSIWGWASWRRVIDLWDGDYTFMKDAFLRHQLSAVVKERGYRSDFMQMCTNHASRGIPYYESIFWASMLMNNGLAIMPTRKIINRMGVTTNSPLFSALNTMPSLLRRIFTMKRFDVNFPLKHPQYVMEHLPYKDHFYRSQGCNYPFIKMCRSFERLAPNLKHSNFNTLIQAFRKRNMKKISKSKYH